MRIKTTGTSGPEPANRTFDGAFDKSVELRVSSKLAEKKDSGESAP